MKNLTLALIILFGAAYTQALTLTVDSPDGSGVEAVYQLPTTPGSTESFTIPMNNVGNISCQNSDTYGFTIEGLFVLDESEVANNQKVYIDSVTVTKADWYGFMLDPQNGPFPVLTDKNPNVSSLAFQAIYFPNETASECPSINITVSNILLKK